MLTNEDQKINKTFGGWLVCWCQRGSVPKGQAQSLLICSHEASTRCRDQKGQALIWLSATCTDQKQRSARHLSNKGLWKQDFWTLPFGKCTSSGSFWWSKIMCSLSTKCMYTFKQMCVWTYTWILYLNICKYIYIYAYICKPPILYTAIYGLVEVKASEVLESSLFVDVF